MKINNWTVAVVLAAVVLVIAIIAGLVWVGKDVEQVIYLILTLLPATIASLIGIRQNVQTKKSVEQVKEEVHNLSPEEDQG